MKDNKISIRSISLFLLGISIIIGGIISISYAYHSVNKSISNTTYNMNMGCLEIVTNTSTYPISQATPTYLYPISDSDALTMNGDYPSTSPGSTNTNQAFGQVGFKIHNNCSTAVKFDIVFVPSAANEIFLNDVKYASCIDSIANNISWTASGGCFTPNGSSSVYSDVYLLGYDYEVPYCHYPTNPFWQYMASSSIGGSALGGVDPKICSVVTDEFPTGKSVAANGTLSYVIRYWLGPEEPYDPGDYEGKALAGKFVVYTIGNELPPHGDAGPAFANGSGTIYRSTVDSASIGDNISVLTNGYETIKANISYNYYIKHIVENYLIIESYACVKYTEGGVLKEACIQGGDPSYYGTFDDIDNSDGDNPETDITGATGNIKKIQSIQQYVNDTLDSVCYYSSSYSSCDDLYTLRLLAYTEGYVSTSDNSTGYCEVDDLGVATCTHYS